MCVGSGVFGAPGYGDEANNGDDAGEPSSNRFVPLF